MSWWSAAKPRWVLVALGLVSLAVASPLQAQITPSQSLQQRLQEDQLRLRLLELDEADADAAPLIRRRPKAQCPGLAPSSCAGWSWRAHSPTSQH